jgi:Ni,Fe-hydrogenase maturation factor
MIDATNKAKISVCLADGTIIKGTLNIRKYNRLSDYLNSKEADQFLIIVDASLPGQAGKVVIINRNQIVWAAPED